MQYVYTFILNKNKKERCLYIKNALLNIIQAKAGHSIFSVSLTLILKAEFYNNALQDRLTLLMRTQTVFLQMGLVL